MEPVSRQPSLHEEQLRRERIAGRQVLLCPEVVMRSPAVRRAEVAGAGDGGELGRPELLVTIRRQLATVLGAGDPESYATLVRNGSSRDANEAVMSALGDGAKVLVLANGADGEQLAELCQRLGVACACFHAGWGQPFDPVEVERAVHLHRATWIVLAHHETSTGMLNPLGAIGSLAHGSGVRLFVDASGSVGADPVDLGSHRVDVCTSSAALALGGVRGVSFVCVRRRSCSDFLQRLPTNGTPPVAKLVATRIAMQELLAGGIERAVLYHRKLAGVLRDRLRSMGLGFQVGEETMSSVLTTVRVPAGIDCDELCAALLKRGYAIGGGTGPLAGQVIRIASMGRVSGDQLTDFSRQLAWVLSILGARKNGSADRVSALSALPFARLQQV